MQKKTNYFTTTEYQNFIVGKRKIFGLKQYEVAQLADIEPEVYRKYELGIRNPGQERGNKILEVLENYEREVYYKRLDKAIELLTDMRNCNYFYIYHKKGLLSAINKFIKTVNDII